MAGDQTIEQQSWVIHSTKDGHAGQVEETWPSMPGREYAPQTLGIACCHPSTSLLPFPAVSPSRRCTRCGGTGSRSSRLNPQQRHPIRRAEANDLGSALYELAA
jgi:hypothetical protein